MKMIRRLAPVLVVAALAAPVYAGAKWVYTVGINASSRYAVGNSGAARNSADATQHIECGVYSGSPTSMFCGATDSTGASAYCTSTDPSVVAVAASISGDSYIYFTWDTGGRCTYVFTESGSRWEPKR